MPIADRKRAARPVAVDPTAWKDCAELGLLGLGLPEESAAPTAALPEEALLFRELGDGSRPGRSWPPSWPATLPSQRATPSWPAGSSPGTSWSGSPTSWDGRRQASGEPINGTFS